jgi:nicotinamidase-related amidase
MDIQTNIIGRIGDQASIERLTRGLPVAISTARAAGITIIYVTVAFRKGFPEMSPDNRAFSMVRQNPATASSMEEPASIHPAVAPQPGDILVTKRRVSAFTGSDLEVVLRSGNYRHLVLAGIATSGVVLSTLREAADRDYQITVLSDGCADPDPEVHNFLLAKIFPRQAEVQTVADWAAGLGIREGGNGADHMPK